MSNLRPFQVALYFGFGLLFIGALILLNSVTIGGSDEERIGPVEIWGTLDTQVFSSQIGVLRSDDDRFADVTYRQLDEQSFDSELVNAIAEGRQPDAIILSSEKLVLHRRKLLPIQYDIITERTFRDNYLDIFDIFARPDGIYALPLVADPLVMYWNRDLFAQNGFANPPRTWEEVVNNTVPTIVRRNTDRTITTSPIALGHYENVLHSYEIVSTLLLQSGSRMVEEENGEYKISLNSSYNERGNVLANSLEFFTRFGDSGDPLYSWSRTKADDRGEFLASRLAIYLGRGSEYESLRRQNPNLNFDVAPVPQSGNSQTPRVYAESYGFAILRTADNQNGAFTILSILSNEQNSKQIADTLHMAPAHRGAIQAGNSAPALQVVYNTALIARSWLNPDSASELFRQSVGDIQANRRSISQTVSDLLSRIRSAF